MAVQFNNPILSDTYYNFPSAIKVNDTYYVIANTVNISKGIFPIHISRDLVEWKSAGFVFDDNTKPSWALEGSLITPVIHQIGPNFVLYFAAQRINSKTWDIGVAIAAHPVGPYTCIDRPIVSLPHQTSCYPAIIKNECRIFLIWTSNMNEIKARQLNTNGLSFSSEQVTSLLKPSLDWEKKTVHFPWYIRRGKYHYLFYSGGGDTNVKEAGVGVARSLHELGPYEKLNKHKLLKKNKHYEFPHDVSVVKNLDDIGDIIFFKAYQKKDPEKQFFVLAAALSWDPTGWPHVGEY